MIIFRSRRILHMTAKEVYNKISKYTNDRIVLSIARNFLNNNTTVRWIQDIFGIEVDQKIRLNISKKYNKRSRKQETYFSFTTGLLFKKTFTIRFA